MNRRMTLCYHSPRQQVSTRHGPLRPQDFRHRFRGKLKCTCTLTPSHGPKKKREKETNPGSSQETSPSVAFGYPISPQRPEFNIPEDRQGQTFGDRSQVLGLRSGGKRWGLFSSSSSSSSPWVGQTLSPGRARRVRSNPLANWEVKTLSVENDLSHPSEGPSLDP